MYANQPLLPRWKEVHVSPYHPRKLPRRKVLAKRRDPAGLHGKITWWFEKQPALQESLSQQSNGPPEEPTSDISPARTIPVTSKPNVSAGNQQRRRRCKQAKKEAALDLKEASQELSSDASPYLHPRKVPRKPKQSTLAMDLSVVKDAKTTTDAVKNKEAMSVNTNDVMQFQDRKSNDAAVST